MPNALTAWLRMQSAVSSSRAPARPPARHRVRRAIDQHVYDVLPGLAAAAVGTAAAAAAGRRLGAAHAFKVDDGRPGALVLNPEPRSSAGAGLAVAGQARGGGGVSRRAVLGRARRGPARRFRAGRREHAHQAAGLQERQHVRRLRERRARGRCGLRARGRERRVLSHGRLVRDCHRVALGLRRQARSWSFCVPCSRKARRAALAAVAS